MSYGWIWNVNHKTSVYLGLCHRQRIGVAEGLKKPEACHIEFQSHLTHKIGAVKHVTSLVPSEVFISH